MLARRGIALIPDRVTLVFKNAKEKNATLQLKPNTLVTVKETLSLTKGGGEVHITLKEDGSNHAKLRSVEALQCTSLILDLPSGSCFVWILHLLDHCYPFLKKLTLNGPTDNC